MTRLNAESQSANVLGEIERQALADLRPDMPHEEIRAEILRDRAELIKNSIVTLDAMGCKQRSRRRFSIAGLITCSH